MNSKTLSSLKEHMTGVILLTEARCPLLNTWDDISENGFIRNKHTTAFSIVHPWTAICFKSRSITANEICHDQGCVIRES